jgi:hypothetical protein
MSCWPNLASLSISFSLWTLLADLRLAFRLQALAVRQIKFKLSCTEICITRYQNSANTDSEIYPSEQFF